MGGRGGESHAPWSFDSSVSWRWNSERHATLSCCHGNPIILLSETCGHINDEWKKLKKEVGEEEEVGGGLGKIKRGRLQPVLGPKPCSL